MNVIPMPSPHTISDAAEARLFCRDFLSGSAPRLVFGTNAFAASIAEHVPVDGFINDANQCDVFMGRPVYRSLANVPTNALVVSSVVLGRPHTAARKLEHAGLRHLDYFAFARHSGLPVKPAMNFAGFAAHFAEQRAGYDWLYQSMADETSRTCLQDIVGFRLSQDMAHLASYRDRQETQYFEDFLHLREKGESFVDVGGYDGYTTAYFMKLCPGFDSVTIFEPEPTNAGVIRARFASEPRITVHECGLSDSNATLRMSRQGSGSKLSDNGEHEVRVAPLDNLAKTPFTFLKMDIEGAEHAALDGAASSIARYRPRLAICVYHLINDLLEIPLKVLGFHADYNLYLRHYTEGLDETVMFFVPRQRPAG